MSHYSRLCLTLLVVLSASCVNPGTSAMRQEQARLLSHDLQKLSPSVSAHEADKMAETAIEQSARLSEEYKPARPAWLNNCLINARLRKRGLCYQWRDDLFPHLFLLKSKTLKIHLTTSQRGKFREHNAIAVTARDLPFERGLILDPWRKGGSLWWGHFDQDKYSWVLLDRNLTPVVLRPLLMPELYPPPASTKL